MNNLYPALQFRIARPTHQLEEVLRFYQEGLQLPLLGRFENHNGYSGVMLGLPDYGHHLEFISQPQGCPCPAPSKENLLVLYFEEEEKFLEIKNSIESLGFQPVTPENPYWETNSLTYEDPDGWRIVLFKGRYPQH